MLFIVIKLQPDPAERAIGDIGVAIARKDIPQEYFRNEAEATIKAEELAIQHPQVPYAVMGVLKVIETARPDFIRKKLNGNGELTLEPNDG